MILTQNNELLQLKNICKNRTILLLCGLRLERERERERGREAPS